MATIQNPDSYGNVVTALNGTSSDDYIFNSGANVVINAIEGNNVVTNMSLDDTLTAENVTIQTGAGADTISNAVASKVTINAGEGDDVIGNSIGEDGTGASNVKINAGAGNDSISNTGSTVTINGGYGNDYIQNYASSVTISGGVGNDSVNLLGESFSGILIQYSSGDGKDTVWGFNSSSTLQIRGGTGTYSRSTVGNDIVITVGNGYISLVGAAGANVNITGGTPTTSGGGGDDTVTTPSDNSGVVIDNDNANTLISGTNYADLIDNSGNYATINTYAGNDTVSNWGDTIKIDTGSGDDSIYSYNYYGTINAGTGNDTVSLNSSAHDNIIQYANGDGNDIIYNLGTNNTLSISGGSYSTQTSGSDILVQVGSGTITLAGSTSANIVGSSTSNTTPTNNHIYTGGNAVISNYAGEQIIVGMLPKEWMFYGNDFYYGSNTGTLVVQNVKDKIIDLRDGYGNSFVKAYKATYSGTINGRTWSGFEYIVGSDYGGDAIFAGDGGSSLWGGAGNYSDTLIGGAATDVFVTGKSQGNDVISNASIADVVWLRDVNFSDIKYTASSNGVIGMEFNTGNTLLVGSTSNISAIFQFADGSSRRYNHATKSWQST